MTWLEFTRAITDLATETGLPIHQVRLSVMTTLAADTTTEQRTWALDVVRSALTPAAPLTRENGAWS